MFDMIYNQYMYLYSWSLTITMIFIWITLSFMDRVHLRERSRRFGLSCSHILEQLLINSLFYDKFRILCVRPLCAIFESLNGFLEGIENFEAIVLMIYSPLESTNQSTNQSPNQSINQLQSIIEHKEKTPISTSIEQETTTISTSIEQETTTIENDKTNDENEKNKEEKNKDTSITLVNNEKIMRNNNVKRHRQPPQSKYEKKTENEKSNDINNVNELNNDNTENHEFDGTVKKIGRKPIRLMRKSMKIKTSEI